MSLRSCKVNDKSAEKIGITLGSVVVQNSKLLNLNLSGNQITDEGAIELAKGLRTNRTLLVLNLSGNQIGDLGACRLAETLSRFKMTHEEILRRRTIRKEKLAKEISNISNNNQSQSMRKSRTESERQSSTLMHAKSLKMGSSDKTLGGKSTSKLDQTNSASKDRSKSKENINKENLAGTAREGSNDKSGTVRSKKEKESITSSTMPNLKKEKSEKVKESTGLKFKFYLSIKILTLTEKIHVKNLILYSSEHKR